MVIRNIGKSLCFRYLCCSNLLLTLETSAGRCRNYTSCVRNYARSSAASSVGSVLSKHSFAPPRVLPLRRIMTSSKRLIVDCDVGLDDAQALMMALARSDVQIDAVTAVRGNTTVDQVVRNIHKVLDLCSRPDIPVYRGCSEPLIIQDTDSFVSYHGKDGFGDIAENDIISDVNNVQKTHAVSFLIDAVRQNPGVHTLVCLGPLTNIATALKLDEDFGKNLKACYIMGGNYQARGNVTKTAEFNFHFDPEAAHIVLRNLKCPVILVGWEVCIDHPISWCDYDKMYGGDGTARTFIRVREAKGVDWWRNQGEDYVFADQFTMALAMDKSLITSSFQARCTVELHGHLTRGQMVYEKDPESNCEVVMAVNHNKIVGSLVEAMDKFDRM